MKRTIALPLVMLVSFVGLTGCMRFDSRYPANVSPDTDAAVAIRDQLEAGASGGGGGPVEEIADPTGWATLKGKFSLDGSVTVSALDVNKDLTVCAPGGQKVMAQTVVTGPNNELANVLVFLTTSIPSDNKELWEHPSYADTATAEIEFDQKSCIFLTHVLAMRSTQKLKILNSDPIGHNAKISPARGAGSFNETIPANKFSYYEPGGESPNPFPIECSIHPWMKAYGISRSNPYFAVTDTSGEFEISNVPAGVELEFRVFHEASKAKQYLEEVTLDGAPATWKKGTFSVTLEPDSVKEMQVVVNASTLQG